MIRLLTPIVAATLAVTLAAALAGTKAPPPATTNVRPPPVLKLGNAHVDLGTIKIVRGSHPEAHKWVATPVTIGVDGHADVGWFSFDQSAKLSPAHASLHYGGRDILSYASSTPGGPNSKGNSGTIWSPTFGINPTTATCKVSFVHSFQLSDSSRSNAQVDKMSWSFSFDGGAWNSTSIVKPGHEQLAWTTESRSFLCGGHHALGLRWDFDSVDGNVRKGRGWNLQSLDVSQAL